MVILLLATVGQSLAAQEARRCSEAAPLLAAVRAAVTRYEDIELAKADGYARVGHDFPGMGEHWVNLRIASADRFDPSRPQILLYTHAGNRRSIVGAAFTAIVDAGERMPGPAFLQSAWHEHSGTLDNELLAVDHTRHTTSDSTRVFVLHVWTHGAAPAREFDVENWQLPFRRAGLRSPHASDVVVGRAISLLTSRAYYADVLTRFGVPASANSALRNVIDTHAAAMRRVVARLPAERSWTVQDSTAVRAVWTAFRDDVARRWPATSQQLRALERTPHVRLQCS